MMDIFLKRVSCILTVLLLSQSAIGANTSREVLYEGFTVWLDCQQHGAIRFRYNAQRDTGNFPRLPTFRLDPAVPYECQPSSANTFKTTAPKALTYERGHLVPANHLDGYVQLQC
jgi:endonuclease G, mitochondrial